MESAPTSTAIDHGPSEPTTLTIEAAVLEAIDRAYTTLEGITRFEVTKISGDLTDAGPVFDVEVTIWFTLLERMHE
jgi:flavin-binding protein dodecin